MAVKQDPCSRTCFNEGPGPCYVDQLFKDVIDSN